MTRPHAIGHVEAAGELVQKRILRALLGTFITLTAVIALIGAVSGHWRECVISGVGAAVYALLLLGLDRLGPRRTGYLCILWYFILATGAMATGKGIHDVTMVLFPSGIFMVSLLLPRALLIPSIVAVVAAIAVVGTFKVVASGESTFSAGGVEELIVALLLLAVAGVLATLVVRSLRTMVAERRKAERAVLQSHDELAARNEALQLINELAHRLHRTLETRAIARETVDVLIRLSQPPMVAFYLLEDDGAELELIAEHGFTDEERTAGARLPLDGSLSGIAFREQRTVSSDDIGHDDRAESHVRQALAKRGITSAISVPLLFGDRTLGTLNLLYRERHRFSQLDLDTYQAVAQAVSLALTNARHVAGLEHQAFHDALTDLPNRASLHASFLARLAEAPAGERVGLVLLDLNRFREINEALGHDVGDELLVQIGTRLSGCLVERRHIIFRLGGDEFAVLLFGLAETAEAERLTEQLLMALKQPFQVAGLALEVGASVGVAVYPDHGVDSHELLRCADVAMYHAKRTSAGVSGYARELDQHTPERLALLAELGQAIRDGTLVLHYQPKVALATGSVVGFEALVRWPHPRLGLLPPMSFVPLAETSDVVHPLTYWVVENAVAQLGRFDALLPGLTMAINLSARILLDRNCSQRLKGIIEDAGVAPGRIEFELTETAFLTDPEAARTALGRITAAGARLAIDDFGTGYSSLSYLRRFPVDAIKIDRSFVADLATGEQSRAIVRSTVQLARSLGLDVVAEGIEDRGTAEVLRDMGCDLAQGFFFSPAVPADEITSRISAGSLFPSWQRDRPHA